MKRPQVLPVEVTGVWLVRVGDRVLVRAEIGGSWVTVITEAVDGAFSHIVEPDGMRDAAIRQRQRVDAK